MKKQIITADADCTLAILVSATDSGLCLGVDVQAQRYAPTGERLAAEITFAPAEPPADEGRRFVALVPGETMISVPHDLTAADVDANLFTLAAAVAAITGPSVPPG